MLRLHPHTQWSAAQRARDKRSMNVSYLHTCLTVIPGMQTVVPVTSLEAISATISITAVGTVRSVTFD